ncbi:MAG: dockerin type I repeat-containing protein, partial [Oscillospiraceae bacterium]|nr:dockerin type I repeat-containing protein [Oscillospiraceae bacterium]
MKIKKSNILKSVAGIALASAMFASQLAVPQSSVLDGVLVSENIVSAAAKTVDDCDFVYDAKDYVIGGEDPDNKDQLIIDISDIPAGSVIEEILVEVATGSEDATAMIAIGCHVTGYNEDDWFSASGQDAGDSLIFSYPIPKEAGSVYGTDYTELFVQHWWGTVDTVTVKKVGINIAGGAGSAVAGDFDGDKKIKAPDLVMFAQYMVGEISSEYFDVVADYNGDGTANVVDFIMMKNKLTKNLGNSGITDNGQTAIEFVENISIGWNLGNTLESTCDWIDNPTPAQFETAWGNP